jgi:hypothetical protein
VYIRIEQDSCKKNLAQYLNNMHWKSMPSSMKVGWPNLIIKRWPFPTFNPTSKLNFKIFDKYKQFTFYKL